MAALCIPKGKGEGEVEPPLGDIGAAAGDGAGADDAEARDDETVAPLAVMLSCDMPASTHVGGGGCDVPRNATPRVLVASADPSACCTGPAKSG